jgi:hypothetical protein
MPENKADSISSPYSSLHVEDSQMQVNRLRQIDSMSLDSATDLPKVHSFLCQYIGDDSMPSGFSMDLSNGENWLLIEELSGKVIPSIISLQNALDEKLTCEDCFFSVDICKSVLTIKDMRLPKDNNNPKSSVEFVLVRNGDSIFSPQAMYPLPRRELQILQAGDRLVMRQKGTNVLFLKYTYDAVVYTVSESLQQLPSTPQTLTESPVLHPESELSTQDVFNSPYFQRHSNRHSSSLLYVKLDSQIEVDTQPVLLTQAPFQSPNSQDNHTKTVIVSAAIVLTQSGLEKKEDREMETDEICDSKRIELQSVNSEQHSFHEICQTTNVTSPQLNQNLHTTIESNYRDCTTNLNIEKNDNVADVTMEMGKLQQSQDAVDYAYSETLLDPTLPCSSSADIDSGHNTANVPSGVSEQLENDNTHTTNADVAIDPNVVNGPTIIEGECIGASIADTAMETAKFEHSPVRHDFMENIILSDPNLQCNLQDSCKTNADTSCDHSMPTQHSRDVETADNCNEVILLTRERSQPLDAHPDSMGHATTPNESETENSVADTTLKTAHNANDYMATIMLSSDSTLSCGSPNLLKATRHTNCDQITPANCSPTVKTGVDNTKVLQATNIPEQLDVTYARTLLAIHSSNNELTMVPDGDDSVADASLETSMFNQSQTLHMDQSASFQVTAGAPWSTSSNENVAHTYGDNKEVVVSIASESTPDLVTPRSTAACASCLEKCQEWRSGKKKRLCLDFSDTGTDMQPERTLRSTAKKARKQGQPVLSNANKNDNIRILVTSTVITDEIKKVRKSSIYEVHTMAELTTIIDDRFNRKLDH